MKQPKHDRKRKRCNQCWNVKPLRAFRGKSGGEVQDCKACRDRKRQPVGRSAELDFLGPTMVAWSPRSHVGKLGGIPSSSTSGHTCPDACSLKGNGCYAEFGIGGSWWRALSSQRPGPRGKIGISWEAFLERVRRLPSGQLWRHNVAGDLPGYGDRIDVPMLVGLVMANLLAGARGFTFTHKPVLKSKIVRDAVAGANDFGFVVNVSADSMYEADLVAREGFAPVSVTLPADSDPVTETPAGRTVRVCPAQRFGRATCATCQWCANRDRDFIVGFMAHGQMQRAITLRLSRHG